MQPASWVVGVLLNYSLSVIFHNMASFWGGPKVSSLLEEGIKPLLASRQQRAIFLAGDAFITLIYSCFSKQ